MNKAREEYKQKIKDIETKAAGEVEALKNKLKKNQAIQDEQALDSVRVKEEKGSEIARLKEDIQFLKDSHASDIKKLSTQIAKLREVNENKSKV